MPSYQDISRHTSNVILDPEVSREIWAKTIDQSFFMQAARQISIPGSGVKIQTITGDPQASWVDETNTKPVGFHTFGTKTITPYKLAVIEPFSEEFVRDKAALYNECVNRLPGALSKKFDSTILSTSAPGSGFDVLGNCTKVSLIPGSGDTLYDQFLTVDANITAADGIMTAIGLAPAGKSKVLGAVDSVGHPLFTPGVGSNTVGNILGADVIVSKGLYVAGAAGSPGTPAKVGIAGDFTDAVWGSVEGIKMGVSNQATLTYTNQSAQTVTINLWQQNMVAVRFEIEVAFAVRSTDEFNILTGDTPSA